MPSGEQTAAAWLNALPPDEARAELRACCASGRWVGAVVAGRPYGTWSEVTAAAEAQLKWLRWSDVLEALDAHPRIGRRAEGPCREAAWSRQEQSAAADGADEVRRALVAGNVEYEDRFGHVFLICATGKPMDVILAALRERLGNDPAAEQQIVRAELAAIVRLRLERLATAASAVPAATATAVAADAAGAAEPAGAAPAAPAAPTAPAAATGAGA